MSLSPAVPEAPFFSIIVPTYNRRHMLVAALHSLIDQSFKNWEAIVVDDGGDDGSKAACALIGDSRIRYYWKTNEERSIARNYGVNLAIGKYINFLDSDDYCEANHLENAYKALKTEGFPEVLHVGFCYVAVDGENRKAAKLPESTSTLDSLLYDNPLTGNAIFVRREILSQVKFLDSRYAVISEDWYVWIRLAARHNFHYSHSITACIVKHGGRSTATIDPFRFEKSLNVLIEALRLDEMLRYRLGSRIMNRVIGYQLLGIGQQFLINEKRFRAKAIFYIIRAALTSPKSLLSRRFLACVKKIITFSHVAN